MRIPILNSTQAEPKNIESKTQKNPVPTTTPSNKSAFYTARAQAKPYRLPARALWDATRFDDAHLGIDLAPYFNLQADDRLLVLGSCFARDSMHGMLMRAVGQLSKKQVEPLGAALGHKYNAPSILQALTWIRDDAFDPSLLIELTDGDWFDGHLHPVTHQTSLAEATARHRAALSSLKADLQNATVAILTFDNIEYFLDRKTQTVLNTPPPIDLIDDYSSRFQFHRAKPDDTSRAISAICHELWRINDGMRIITAVSPIPIDATFSGEDILVANQLVKSTLLVALHLVVNELRAEGRPIQYCPTYELVTLQPQRATVWRERDLSGEPDGRHLEEGFARQVLTPLVANATRLRNTTK